jgi:hypothetical protein
MNHYIGLKIGHVNDKGNLGWNHWMLYGVAMINRGKVVFNLGFY